MPAPADLVHETSTTTGTGNFTVAETSGKRRFSSPFGTGGTTNVFDYFISHRTAVEWEIGTGHMSDANTLVRDTVISSSNSNSAVSFSAGTKDITNDIPASKQMAYTSSATAPSLPQAGHLWYDTDLGLLFVYINDGSSSQWVEIGGGIGGSSVNPTPLVGVNATADTTNRLAVSSPASLLNHEGTGHQLKINKAAAANTASLMFQDGFSGRAEFGLTGDDDFHVKVSADGAIWREALVVNKTSGNIGLGTASPNALLHIRGDGSNFNQGLRIENAAGTTDHFDLVAGWGGNYDGEMHFAFNGVSIARLNAFGLSTSPGKNFFITGDGGFISYNDGATGAYMNSGAYLQLQGRDYVRFDVYYSEKMRVLGNGNVGIGTATPACTLDVAGPIRCGSYTVATVPSASIAGAGAQIYVSNESGGAVLAFSDGTSWRRVTDRAVVS